MMKIIRAYLKQPYPLDTSGNWRIAIVTGIFISLFMAGFEPFGLHRLQLDHKKLILAGYGLVTFVILFFDIVILPKLFRKIFNEKYWNIGKHIVYFLFIIFTIGFANLIYSGFTFNFSPLSFSRFFYFELLTLFIGIIPIGFIILWKHNQFLKRNLQSANELSSQLGQPPFHGGTQGSLFLEFHSSNAKNKIKINKDQLLFIESEGNYCNIYYLEENKVRKSVLRTTLKRIEHSIPENSGLFKSHRAFIINPEKVAKIEGNAQGYRLVFSQINKEASVSRQYIGAFRKLMEKRS